MNAAIAVHGDYAYVGSRTDKHDGTPHGGLMVLDISDPSEPDLVAGPLDPEAGESTRELRVWQSKDLLMILNTNCGPGPALHLCSPPAVSNIRFYDIGGSNAERPRLLRTFKVDTHEFFLWVDPKDPERALMFAGNAGSTCGIRGDAPTCPFSVWDISDVPSGGEPKTLYTGLYPYSRFPAAPAPPEKPTGGLHSLTISNDGNRAYFALLTGGFAVVDTSDFAAGSGVPAAAPDHGERVAAGLGRPRRAQRGQALEPRLRLGLRRGLRRVHRHGPRLPVGLDADGRHLQPADAHRRGRVPRARERPVDVHDVEPAEDVVLRAQPDAHAARRDQHLALRRRSRP